MDPITVNDQQYFPTYRLSEKATEVAIKEYESAAATLVSEEKILNLSTSLLVGLIGVATAFYKDNGSGVEKVVESGLSGASTIIASAILFLLISLTITSYFADTRRSVVLAGRKIVILRRLLGINYGHIELILPNRRIEGANEPYHLPMFHGWVSPKAIPIYCITVASGVAVWLFFPRVLLKDLLPSDMLVWANLTIAVWWSAIIALFYRLHLRDQYETKTRIVAVCIAGLLGKQLVRDFEYVIYRARLAVFEAKRLGMPLKKFQPILIALEDRRFLSHNGVSLTAMAAAVFRFFKRGKRSGASTITQQLARSLFIKNLDNSFRRKFIELLLALWFDKQFSKAELAELYVCGVRYEKGVTGIAEAMKHFFPGASVKDISPAMAFFLIERVANIHSKLIVNKVAENIQYLVEHQQLSKNDVSEFLEICRDQIAAKRMKATYEDVHDLYQMTARLSS